MRTTAPLVQCLTNAVTVNFVANTLLAVGASPAMVDVPGEAGPMAGAASAVLINLGTPGAEQREGMLEAAEACADMGRPWVLDPVAVGALPVRTDLAHRLLTRRPTVIRGNASEIRALAGAGTGGRGVDAADDVAGAADAALALARTSGGVVAVSGPVDLVTDGRRTVRITGGDVLLTRVTGGGCALGGVIAAYVASHADPFEAVVTACLGYGIAAERAAHAAAGPAGFAVAFVDALASLRSADLVAEGRIA
ncbi:hydroxyethylthiazole kinase [Microbacterium sp. SORGH_AS_0888]|uniref:hydroxyethylthiazole kinase n=1 Tax=Microbacterium sp. SORGH_AS_0888 TaxID=3041791 RepID=UPI00358E7605